MNSRIYSISAWLVWETVANIACMAFHVQNVALLRTFKMEGVDGEQSNYVRTFRAAIQFHKSHIFTASIFTPWPCRIKVFGEQWVNQWYWVSQGVTKVN